MRQVLCLDGPLEGQFYELNEGLSSFMAYDYASPSTIQTVLHAGHDIAHQVRYQPDQWVIKGQNGEGFMIWVAWCSPHRLTLDAYLSHILRPEVLANGRYYDGYKTRVLEPKPPLET